MTVTLSGDEVGRVEPDTKLNYHGDTSADGEAHDELVGAGEGKHGTMSQ